jgi:UDP-N-acetyl-D-glucosamine dehydrogenase
MPLLTKINSKSAHIAVIGLGYVGLPLVIEFCRAGFNVTGFDVDEQKIALLRQGKSYIRHIDLGKIGGEIGTDSLLPQGNRYLSLVY